MICINHEGAQLRVAELGGELRGYRGAAGTEYLWSGDPAVWKGVSPVLFPAIGALRDGGASIAGVRYPVPRHGFARELPFRVSEQGDDFITLTLTETAETRRLYPFDFALNVTHRLCADGFETRFTVENHTGRDMPFLIGGHPAFACPVGGEGRFEDYVLRFEKPEDGHVSLCDLATHLVDRTAPAPLEADMRTLPLRHADYDRIDTFIFDGLRAARWTSSTGRRGTASGFRLTCRCWPCGPCRARTPPTCAWNRGRACPPSRTKPAASRTSPTTSPSAWAARSPAAIACASSDPEKSAAPERNPLSGAAPLRVIPCPHIPACAGPPAGCASPRAP